MKRYIAMIHDGTGKLQTMHNTFQQAKATLDPALVLGWHDETLWQYYMPKAKTTDWPKAVIVEICDFNQPESD